MEALHNHKKIKEKENKTKPREMKTQAKNKHNSNSENFPFNILKYMFKWSPKYDLKSHSYNQPKI